MRRFEIGSDVDPGNTVSGEGLPKDRHHLVGRGAADSDMRSRIAAPQDLRERFAPNAVDPGGVKVAIVRPHGLDACQFQTPHQSR